MKRWLLPVFAIMVASLPLRAQQDELLCNAEYPYGFLRKLKMLQKDSTTTSLYGRNSVTSYPVAAFIIRTSDGSGGMSTQDFSEAFDLLNTHFIEAGIEFFLCQSIQSIDNDVFYTFNKLEENTLTSNYHLENSINLYIPNKVTTPSGTEICGYADFPGWGNKVIIAGSCASDGVTLAHEFGHIFGLSHTHGNSNITLTDELANFLNCAVAGDDICDTPADPNLYEQVDTNCYYIGTEIDNNHQPFQPYVGNIMSYAPKHCQTGFTTEQYLRMQFVSKYFRSDLNCTDLSASFTATPQLSLCENIVTVAFDYTGTGASSYAWDIDGDEITDYTNSNPVHEYAYPGNYPATLTVSNGIDTVHKTLPSLIQIIEQYQGNYYDTVSTYSGPVSIINPDGKITWEIKQLGPLQNNVSCWLVDNYHYNASGTTDQLIFGPIQLNNNQNATLSFDISYAPYNPQRSDGLSIEISTDCGGTFDQIYFKEGLELGTSNGYFSNQWLPISPSDWRHEIIDISGYNTSQPLIIKFNNITAFGNNLFIDNIEIGGQPPLTTELISFKGKSISSELNMLFWETNSEESTKHYSIEISQDGIYFYNLDNIPAQGAIHNVYQYKHRNPVTQLYYRLAIRDKDGSVQYSGLIHLGDETTRAVFISPNPVRDILHIVLSDDQAGQSIQLINQKGQVIEQIHHFEDGNRTLNIDVYDLLPGLYTAVIGESRAMRFMKVD